MNESLPTWTIWEHLAELKKRITRAFWVILVGFLIAFSVSEQIFTWIKKPIIHLLPGGKLVFLSPFEKFASYMKVSFVFGLLISSPVWFYQIYAFFAPALYSHEKKIFWKFFSLSILFLLIGIGFSWGIAIPTAFKFLIEFGDTSDIPLITIEEYLNFVLWFVAGFGIAFQLPVLLMILGWAGVISSQSLRNHRKYIVLALSIITAIITPPDVLSMLLLLGPLWLLFELSILAIWLMEKRQTT